MLGRQLGLPIKDGLTESRTDGRDVHFGSDKFFVPGSVLSVKVHNDLPAAFGMGDRADVMFDNSPAFTLPMDGGDNRVRPIAWFDSKKPLRSGWAWGQEHLENLVAMCQATVGKGQLYLFGPEIAFRAQPHGTFKLLLNSIMLSTAKRVELP